MRRVLDDAARRVQDRDGRRRIPGARGRAGVADWGEAASDALTAVTHLGRVCWGRKTPVNRCGPTARTPSRHWSPKMRVLGLAVVGIFAITVPVAGHADAPKLNLRPADQGATSKILLVAEGGRSG